MKKFHVQVMSIDPEDTSEDPHQKYGQTIEANDKAEAERIFKEGFQLPIFWIKVYDIDESGTLIP